MKIVLNAGHTLSGAGTGAVGVVKETDKNREVLKRLTQMLQEKGHTVVNATIDKSSNDLRDITNLANKHKDADLFISIHLNAFNGAAYGVETHIYNGSWSGKSKLKAKAQTIQNELSKIWYNRGVKESNFHVLRETAMDAILLELGFCDNASDMKKWNTEEICKRLFKGIIGVEYTTTSTGGSVSQGNTYYRVIVGSYKERSNAEAQQKKLKEKGFDSFLEAFKK